MKSDIPTKLIFYCFRARLWMEACHRKDLLPKIDISYKRYKLCEFHFEAKYISRGSTRKSLLPNAYPTIFPKREETNDNPERSSEPCKKVIILSGMYP